MIALCVVAGLGGLAELGLRLLLPGIIANAVREPLDLPGDVRVDVALGGSTLLNAVRGGVGDVTIEVPEAPIFEGLTADAMVHAGRIPFNPTSGRISDATIELRAPSSELGTIMSLATDGLARTGQVVDGDLVVGGGIEAFGQDMSVSARLSIDVVDGEVEIRPRQVQAAGFDLTPVEISRATGSQLDPLIKTHRVCLDEFLPRGVTVTGLELVDDGPITISAELSPTILSDLRQQRPGTCS